MTRVTSNPSTPCNQVPRSILKANPDEDQFAFCNEASTSVVPSLASEASTAEYWDYITRWNRFVVAGFSRVSTDGVWLYFWPRDEAQAKLWDRCVRSYRMERRALDLPLISSKGNCSATAPDTWGSPPPKKRKGAYDKRQHQITSKNHPGWNGTIQHPLHEIHEGGFYCEESQDRTNARPH
ncbi:hypothetical protein CAPTEDRAFT_205866 [Capitella teleta]|uniref:Uncharacterized protein n=1 Tax=Capitella teleta TaxID=283909 RepID=R7TUJ2_CAPTE|nr:hypothetical protein CAPTEDRAFT_205866 [Capitella teleta]|eukprot:ELT97588.1 hypothetical protein CAPTEDRAFT_205866 [Capitella teleta]